MAGLASRRALGTLCVSFGFVYESNELQRVPLCGFHHRTQRFGECGRVRLLMRFSWQVFCYDQVSDGGALALNRKSPMKSAVVDVVAVHPTKWQYQQTRFSFHGYKSIPIASFCVAKQDGGAAKHLSAVCVYCRGARPAQHTPEFPFGLSLEPSFSGLVFARGRWHAKRGFRAAC